MKRQSLAFKRLKLTQFKVNVPRGSSSKVVAKVLQKEKFADQWASSSYAQKLAVLEKRGALTDFDRFKLMLAKKQRRAVVYKQVNVMKKQQWIYSRD